MVVGIAGIGGIGSNVARLLAQAKVGQIKVVDFDEVEVSNLNRQFYRTSQAGKLKTDSLVENLKQIYPEMKIKTVDQKIEPGDCEKLFSDCDVVVEGFDDKVLKKMIIEELGQTSKVLVSACGIAGDNLDQVSIKKMGNCHIVGDFVSDQDDHDLFPPKISMITAIMAKIVLEQLKGKTHE